MCQNKISFPPKFHLNENGGCQNQNFADEPNTFYPENLAASQKRYREGHCSILEFFPLSIP